MLELHAGTPLTDAIQNAQRALANANIEAATKYYTEALMVLGGSAEHSALRLALWIEHLDALVGHEQFNLASQYAHAYWQQAQRDGDGQAEQILLILLAEIFMALGHAHRCRHYLEQVHKKWGAVSTWQLAAPEYIPRFIRLRGLLSGEEGDYNQSRRLLNEALAAFTRLGHSAGQHTVQNDLRRLALVAGDGSVVDEILRSPNIQDTYDLLLVARALRRDARYETAARLLAHRIQYPVELTWRFPLLHELVLLYLLLADQAQVTALLPLLEEAAITAAQPAEAMGELARLRAWDQEGFIATTGTNFEARLTNVRAFIQQGQLPEAEATLRQLTETAGGPRHDAYWHLVAGELELALGMVADAPASLLHGEQAIAQLERAANLAIECSLPEVYTQSVRLIGRVYEQIFHDLEKATAYWVRSSKAEELIAHWQETDQARIRFLEALPTQYDALIEATANRVDVANSEKVAPVIAAMESARGAAILSHILPAETVRMRDVPLASDSPACVAWIAAIIQQLPPDMAIWILHATPDHLHHGLVAHNFLHWHSVAVGRTALSETIATLKDYWEIPPAMLEDVVQHEPSAILELLAQVSQMMQVEDVLATLPSKITRLAIVAGDALGDIPFAALPYGDPGAAANNAPKAYLITKFALSMLPCMSALAPIQVRAAAARGQRRLLIEPPAPDLAGHATHTAEKETTCIGGPEATAAKLQATLDATTFPIIRFDGHGKHWRDNALCSWLQVVADTTHDGQLTAEQFTQLSLKQCGTLILGACESGMSHRIGRDERLGFVRAGFATGAASVLASGWIAAHVAAKTILDRFEHNLRFLPRDMALQKAVQTYLKTCQQEKDFVLSRGLINADHPARWACWTLHGDVGLQTKSNWLTRYIRNCMDHWRQA